MTHEKQVPLNVHELGVILSALQLLSHHDENIIAKEYGSASSFDKEQLMNEQDIEMFMKSFDDFMNHADVEIQNYVRREAVRKFNQTSLEQKAAEMEVTVDYYMSEFM